LVAGWKLNHTVTPTDAEAMALQHEEHRRKELESIDKKASWWRVVELFFLVIPIAIVSPLWIIHPSLFWTIVASQIDRSGPCFIKFAQWLSTRRDIFSDELCECLSVMHEKVQATWSAGVSPKEVRTLLENTELPIKWVEDVATSSGSIAQVYFGELVDGTQIAVKCLRPGVRELLEGDLAWMLYISDVVNKLPKFSMLGLRRAAEDFSEHVQMQVDFEIEASNLRRFQRNFAESEEWVRFPMPLHATKELLVLTWEKGQNLASVFRAADGLARKDLATAELHGCDQESSVKQRCDQESRAIYCSEPEMTMLKLRSDHIQEVLAVPASTTRKLSAELLACYMRMVFNDAFLHGDMHPGNMIVRMNEGAYVPSSDSAGRSSDERRIGGWKHHAARILPKTIRKRVSHHTPPFELVLLDAGLAIPLAPKRVEALRSMAISMLYCDFKGAATHIYDQSPDHSRCVDPDGFKTDLANVFRGVRKNVGEAGYAQVSDACLECLRLVRQHQVLLDTGLTWALFAMLSTEGSARQLDPQADCTGAAARYVVTIPSLFREMKNQSPDTIRGMVRELVFGRQTHQAEA
jgi:predicted unusual protein kinase regulating ubiquinone biosynthesis (AarF/ABC1/UbiB family)